MSKSPTQYGLTAIGNAIVDILAPCTPEFLAGQAANGMNINSMNLIDATRVESLYKLMGPTTEMSGGSAGNTMAAFTSLGGKGAYIGKVANDQFGKIFTHDMHAMGIHFQTPPLQNSISTAQCLILVTPDAVRTMNTYLGACVCLDEDDINEHVVGGSAITYLEGYLFDPPAAKRAFFKAAEIVQQYGRQLSLTLSDAFCVNRHRDDLIKLVNNHVDILFANETELMAYTSMDNIEDALQAIQGKCGIVAVTLGKEGSVIVTPDEKIAVKSVAPTMLVDTTGAGDAYAAGFLYGLTEGKPLAECGRIGSVAASEVISHMGPRPQKALSTLI